MRARVLAVALFLAACGGKPKPAPVKPAPPVAKPTPPPAPPTPPPTVGEQTPKEPAPPPEHFDLPTADKPIDLDTRGVMDRSPSTHGNFNLLVVAWSTLDRNYHGHLPPKAARRTNAEAAQLAKDFADKLRKDPNAIEQLAAQDDNNARTDFDLDADMSPEANVREFAARLHEGEVGIVMTAGGYNVVSRLPAEPLETADVWQRPAEEGQVFLYHVTIGYRSSGFDERSHRTKAEADKLAADVATKMRDKKTDIVKLMKDVSEETDDYTKADAVDLGDGAQAYGGVGARLKIGEVGIQRTRKGLVVLKRIAPPPADPLESAAIMARTKPESRVVIQQIRLAWVDAHYDADETSSKRTRKELETVLKKILARAADKKTKFEDLMTEQGVSTDPIEVTVNGRFVPRLENLCLRLKVNEIGVAKTRYGMHIVRRVE